MSSASNVPVPTRSGSIVNGPPSAGVNPPHSGTAQPTTPSGQNTSHSQNLNQIVLEYLGKKGYTKTEAVLRQESEAQETSGHTLVIGGAKYERAYTLLENFVDNSLEAYRPELVRLLWPIFVHCILNLAAGFFTTDCQRFYSKFRERFEREHEMEVRQLATITSRAHLEASIAKTYRGSKYRLSLTSTAYTILLQFLEQKESEGGPDVVALIQAHLNIVTIDRSAAGRERSLAAMMSRRGEEFDYPAEDEGIPGHNPGSANTGPKAPLVLAKLALGPTPMDPDMMEDVQAGLAEEDARNPPDGYDKSLVDVFAEKIKKEPSDDSPSRDAVPLPPPLARDVAMEIQKVREHRDRFKIDPRTGGVAPGISVCMYTFHNTHDSINCLDFSGDLRLVAAGTNMSYIQVWSLDGKPLVDAHPDISDEKPPNSRRLIGHSGPVYAVSFDPGTAKPPGESPPTNSRLLLSSSADKTIRLWSLDGWVCLVMYRAHHAPVWDVKWGPHGHYFLSCGHDRVARVWSQEHIAPLRMFAGHDNDVDCGCFHPNGAYVFTAGDKSVRMWDIMKGTAVRMFTGHIGNITAIECSPDGKTLASADDQGTIALWDLTTGLLSKRMRGHGKGGIWSLSWSVESTVLVSGGADMTVRVWDATLKPAERAVDGAAKLDGSVGTAVAVTSTTTTQKKSKKDLVVTPDQISAFPTKKSPVYKVYFSRSNLVLAGSAYMPEPA